MEATTELEKNELVKLENRVITLTSAVVAYKGNPKALKLILKLVKMEGKAANESKAPVPANDLKALAWRYDDLADIVKRLTQVKKPEVCARAASELDTLISNTESEIAMLTYVPEPEPELVVEQEELKPTAGEKAKEFAQKVSEGAHKFGDKAKAGAEIIGNKVGGAMESAFASIKNAFKGNNDDE